MKLRLLFFLIPIITSFCSCENEKQKTVKAKETKSFLNDGESFEWIGQSTLHERPNAHSGKNVSVIDSVDQYSLGFKKRMKELDKSATTALFSYWIFVKDASAQATSVYSVDLNGKNLSWTGPRIQDRVKEFNKWVQVTEVFNLPVGADPETVVAFYVWNNSKEEILVDDVSIEFR